MNLAITSDFRPHRSKFASVSSAGHDQMERQVGGRARRVVGLNSDATALIVDSDPAGRSCRRICCPEGGRERAAAHRLREPDGVRADVRVTASARGIPAEKCASARDGREELRRWSSRRTLWASWARGASLAP